MFLLLNCNVCFKSQLGSPVFVHLWKLLTYFSMKLMRLVSFILCIRCSICKVKPCSFNFLKEGLMEVSPQMLILKLKAYQHHNFIAIEFRFGPRPHSIFRLERATCEFGIRLTFFPSHARKTVVVPMKLLNTYPMYYVSVFLKNMGLIKLF